MARNIILFFLILGCVAGLVLVLERAHNRDAAYHKILTGTCPHAEDQSCAEDLIVETVLTRGLPDGFRMLKVHYVAEPEFRPDCHAVAFKVGSALARAVEDYTTLSYTPESVWCNYGFYQAYPETLLLSGASVEYVRGFCEYVGEQLRDAVPGVEAECFRGIGRALPFINESVRGDPARMAAFATKTCKEIAPGKDEYADCASGAFNQLGREEIAKKYDLSVNTSDPLALCREQPKEVQEQCYGNLHWTSHSLVNQTGDFSTRLQDAITIFGATTTRSLQETIWTLGYEEGRKSVARNGVDVSAVRACASLPPALQARCVQGISTGLVKHGTPGEQHTRVIEFCAATMSNVPPLQETDCAAPAIRYLRRFYSPSQFQNTCKDFTAKLGISCG